MIEKLYFVSAVVGVVFFVAVAILRDDDDLTPT
jgi:hypothetical protein